MAGLFPLDQDHLLWGSLLLGVVLFPFFFTVPFKKAEERKSSFSKTEINRTETITELPGKDFKRTELKVHVGLNTENVHIFFICTLHLFLLSI